MADTQTISVQDSFDIIEARVQVRNLARDLGFDLYDQARISLATSTLAYILGLGREEGGQIWLGRYDGADQVGLRIVCTRTKPLRHEIPAGVMDDARRMVDEMNLEVLPTGETRITLLKWPGRPRKESVQPTDAAGQTRQSIT